MLLFQQLLASFYLLASVSPIVSESVGSVVWAQHAPNDFINVNDSRRLLPAVS